MLSDTKHLNKNGIGLNLYIAKLIVNKLSGEKITVESAKGLGSEFTFCIEAQNADQPVQTKNISLILDSIKEVKSE